MFNHMKNISFQMAKSRGMKKPFGYELLGNAGGIT